MMTRKYFLKSDILTLYGKVGGGKRKEEEEEERKRKRSMDPVGSILTRPQRVSARRRIAVIKRKRNRVRRGQKVHKFTPQAAVVPLNRTLMRLIPRTHRCPFIATSSLIRPSHRDVPVPHFTVERTCDFALAVADRRGYLIISLSRNITSALGLLHDKQRSENSMGLG